MKGLIKGYRDRVGKSAFLLVLLPPLLMVAAVVPIHGDILMQYPASTMAVMLTGLLPAAAIGYGLARREPGPASPLPAPDEPVEGEASLSAEQAATYRDLFENATDIVFTTDLSGHFLAGNKAVQRLLGYTVDEAKSLTWEKLVAPYDMWKARQMYKRHAAGEKRISFELDTVTAGGEIRTFDIGSRPMYREGELCGFHAIARDITTRKEMEQQLEDARREAETANAFKSTFLANMSHEIRTPINGILGFLSLFARTELTARQKEYLLPIEESAKSLLKIINDVLDLSKIEAGRVSIDNEIFSFRDVVNSSVELLRPMAENKGLALVVEYDPAIPRYVVGDGTRVGQVVSNLVNNAVKFTDVGSVSVTSRISRRDRSQLSVSLAVRDTGIGIAPEHQKRLFEPFHQIDASPGRRYAGTGLGLAISRSLIEAMGGEISLHSEAGEFTEVVCEIPFGLAPAEPDARAPEPDRPRDFDGAGLAALIVDDNEINRWFLGAVLEQQGFDVGQASSGGAALEACWKRRFDVVLMDIHMADMDGTETTRRLRAQIPAYRQIPVVAVSADVMGNRGSRFIEQGLDYFLAKPVREDQLVDLLSRLFPARAAAKGGASDSSAAEPGAPRVLDRDRGIGLASGDETLWRRSLEVVRSQLRDALPVLRSAVAENARGDIAELAHRLAGGAAYAAADELASSARKLERAAADEEPADLLGPLADLDAAAGRFFAATDGLSERS